MKTLNIIKGYSSSIFKSLEQQPFAVGFIVNVVICFIGCYFRPMFQTNDDPGMIFAFSGSFIFDSPAPVTAFTSKIWGLINIFGYSKFGKNGLEVYSLLLALVGFISLNICSYIILKDRKLTIVSIFILVMLTTWVFIPFYNRPQFTMASGIAMIAGLLAILWPANFNNGFKILGLLILVVGYLIRPSNFGILYPLFIVSIFVGLYFIGKLQIRKYIVTSLILGILLIGVGKLDGLLHTPSEKRFENFNLFRGSINDFSMNDSKAGTPRAEYLSKMKPEGLELFNQWFYSDPFLYNAQVDYQKLNASVAQSDIFQKERIQKNIKELKAEIKRQIKDKYILGSICLFSILLWFGNPKTFKMGLVFLGLFIGAFVIISIFLKPVPFRLSFVFLTAFLIILIISEIDFDISISKSFKSMVSAVGIAFCILFVVGYYWPLRNWKYQGMQLQLSPEKIYIMQHDIPPFLDFDPYHTRKNIQSQTVLCTGSFGVLPQAHRELNGKKIKYITEEVLRNPERVGFLVDNTKWGLKYMQVITDYFKAQYSKNVVFHKIGNNPYEYSIEIVN